MRWKKERLAFHAGKMLLRNIRSYGMLSVTIALSFSILLGYLVFVDSNIFTSYKEIFATPSNVIMASTEGKPEIFEALKHVVVKTDPEAQLYQYIEEVTKLTQYGEIGAKISFLPEGERPVYREVTNVSHINGEYVPWNSVQEVRLKAGCNSFDLKGNEAVINESFYQALQPDEGFPFSLDVPYYWSDGSYSVFKLSVIGVCTDTEYESAITINENGVTEGSVHIYTTQSVLDGHTVQNMISPTRVVWIGATKPDAVAASIQQLDVVVHAACVAQSEALSTIRMQLTTKAVIAAILLLICGTNLFSSFTNALADRKFEIGVKRAIGASAWSIVIQFLLEGVLVMLVNILLAIALVADVFAVYKIVRQLVYHEQWIIRISAHSVAMFGVCSVFVTVLFSAIFAYKATRVEIGTQLKVE